MLYILFVHKLAILDIYAGLCTSVWLKTHKTCKVVHFDPTSPNNWRLTNNKKTADHKDQRLLPILTDILWECRGIFLIYFTNDLTPCQSCSDKAIMPSSDTAIMPKEQGEYAQIGQGLFELICLSTALCNFLPCFFPCFLPCFCPCSCPLSAHATA